MKKVILLLIILSIPALLSLLLPGGYEPHDFHHVADIYEMARAIGSGQFPPRLGPDFMFGFGYPLFNYYYVLPFYLGAFFYSVTGSLMTAFKYVFLVSGIVSVIGMYFFLRKFFGNLASIAGSILYLYTPFRAVEIYVRGAIGEAVAIAILPWVLFFFTSLINKTTSKNIAFASIALALFFLTHNYFFLFGAPFIGLFLGILIYFEKKRLEKIKALVVSGLLAVGLSAFWWLPAFIESNLVASITPFVLIDHFPFVKQLIIPSWGYGSSVWGPTDEISFQIGLVNLMVVLVSILLLIKLIKKGFKNIIALWAIGCFIVVVFMMNIRSLFIWNLVPFTNFIQFPWRLLSFTTFFSAFLAGYAVENIKYKRIICLLIIALSMLFTVGYFKPSKIINKTNDGYLAHFFNNSQYSEDYLQLPLTVKQKPDRIFTHKFISDGSSIILEENKVSDVRWEAAIDTVGSSEIQVAVLDFPGWFVEVDGQRIDTYPTGNYGQLAFLLNSGIHEVELYWAETDLRIFAAIVSLISLCVILLHFRRGLKHDKI